MPSQNRVVPVAIVILVLAALAVLAPVLAKFHNQPATWVAKIEVMSANQPAGPDLELKHNVWVNQRSGFYYCRQSKFYGRIHPGLSMRQGPALLRGYRPAEGGMCP